MGYHGEKTCGKNYKQRAEISHFYALRDFIKAGNTSTYCDVRYSYLSACVGAIRDALRAGTYAASIVTINRDGTKTT